ncbi:penicillin-binding protein 1C [Psychrobium sp. MM17-31]|uniref:penicillin-binding protein 1C n=1 Tax=Psychrobium sp. MM17-31 TaxID=2917758 RepID=UPI001EF5B34F|nr:penicillin-binding protein 1C [Psychrobium sp. MM17-31]MCG7532436.1 penicillin-binding protein 1C [Psychrobium sp. MM17-31]
MRWWQGAIAAMVTVALSLTIADKLAPLDLSKLNDGAVVVSDSDGRPLRAFANAQGIWRYRVKVEDVSPHYLQALFTYEDRHFYQHPGVNPLAMIRAVGQAIYHGKAISGGSTITMQVARLLHPNKRSINGKLYQMLRALQLEWHFSKAQILEIYLNIAPFGGPIEGVQAASYVYFDKPASQLTHNEAALLAVLPQSPSRYRPDRYPKRALQARNKLLERMVTYQQWPRSLVDTLKADPIYADYFAQPNIAPLLSRRLKSATKPSDLATDIATFIDGNLQEQLEYQVKDYLHRLPAKTSAAVLVMDGLNGEVKAYLGSGDFSDNERYGHVDMIKAVRSPGSTLKPFVYGDAIENGLIHEQSLLHDTPIIKGDYRPHNFSGGYSGPVSTSDALLRSLNLPVLQVLNYGASEALSARLNNAGLQLRWPRYASANKALVLGGVGVKLESLVSAYSALINQGQAIAPRYRKDTPLAPRFLLEPQSAWIIQNILRQQQQPGRLSEHLSAHQNTNIGWKTGTSYDFRDAWVIGFSGRYIIGVWIGRADAVSVANNTGNNHALPLFLQTANQLNDTYQPQRPPNVSQQKICWPSGKLASESTSENCLELKEAWLVDNQAPSTLASISPDFSSRLQHNYYLEPDGTRANLLCASEDAKAQTIALWPPALDPWVASKLRNQQRFPRLSSQCPPEQQSLQPLIITSIKPGSHFIRIKAKALHLPLLTNQKTQQIFWFLNGVLIDKSNELIVKNQGSYQLIALSMQGQLDKVNFFVE